MTAQFAAGVLVGIAAQVAILLAVRSALRRRRPDPTLNGDL